MSSKSLSDREAFRRRIPADVGFWQSLTRKVRVDGRRPENALRECTRRWKNALKVYAEGVQ